eukprot:1409581-Rhodomonas_salina.1
MARAGSSAEHRGLVHVKPHHEHGVCLCVCVCVCVCVCARFALSLLLLLFSLSALIFSSAPSLARALPFAFLLPSYPSLFPLPLPPPSSACLSVALCYATFGPEKAYGATDTQ